MSVCLRGVYNSKVLITPHDRVNRISKLRCDLSLTGGDVNESVWFVSDNEVQLGSVQRGSLCREKTPNGSVCVCVYELAIRSYTITAHD